MSGFVEEMARKRAVDVQEQKKIQQQKHEAAIENHQIKMVESFKNSVVYKEFPKETLWEMEFDSPGGNLIVTDPISGIQFLVASSNGSLWTYYKAPGVASKRAVSQVHTQENLETYCLHFVNNIKEKEMK